MKNRCTLLLLVTLCAALAEMDGETPPEDIILYKCRTLRRAIIDLSQTFPQKYGHAHSYLAQLDSLQKALAAGDPQAPPAFKKLYQRALLDNPLLDMSGILLVKRRQPDISKEVRDPAHRRSIFGWGGKVTQALKNMGIPSNHECNSSLKKSGYDNQIAVLSPVHPMGRLKFLYTPPDSGYVGEIDLHWDGKKLLFTRSDAVNWNVWQINTDGSGLRRISHTPDDVDSWDACYLPGGRIVFGSNASYQSVPCWHGKRRVSNLYLMNGDGTGMRRLCFDQDHDFHPAIMGNGQVLYHRWDYTGINHIFFRQLMVMNPDGTGQRALYGSNSWFPNALYFPRNLPGNGGRIVCILSGYHGAHRMGRLVVVDVNRGFYDADGLVCRISGRGRKIEPKIKDNLVDLDWPKFLHPYPLSDKYFLVSAWPGPEATWGIYLADVFDNLVLLHKMPGYALLEPVPLIKRPVPPVIPDRIKPEKENGVVYLHNVYSGPGLDGVPGGVVKKLRIIAYHFGYPGLAGPHKIGYGGPWEAMRIVGTVPLEEDGSAMFHVPANTPLAVQPLDEKGRAVQLMRSWFTVMPGEVRSCIGCHESPADAVPLKTARAALRTVRDISPWYGPARGFDFEREVQPVLTAHCMPCHDGASGSRPDLRPEKYFTQYRGKKLSTLGVRRLHPDMVAVTGGCLPYTPAYDALLPYVRRVGIEDDVKMLVPAEYRANTSELIQMLEQGHHGVRLDPEAWDRLYTWIDLNAPCHGTWGDVFPVPDGADKRRLDLQQRYGGPAKDFEQVPVADVYIPPVKSPVTGPVSTAGLFLPPTGPKKSLTAHNGNGPHLKTVPLGRNLQLQLARVPAGRITAGHRTICVDSAFWMAATEITNAQYRLFEKDHDSRYFGKRHARSDDMGLTLDGDNQPVVRISWRQAAAFCEWLSRETGMAFYLPDPQQWEFACRAGSADDMHYGGSDENFTAWANMGDKNFSRGKMRNGLQITGGVEHLDLEGAALCDTLYDDGMVVTAPVGSYRPNGYGLYDMHGNAAEWTNSKTVLKAACGGSFFDRPQRCRAGSRNYYPDWQKVFNVGFRVACTVRKEDVHDAD